MASYNPIDATPSREQALHALSTRRPNSNTASCALISYAAFSLKSSVEEGLSGGASSMPSRAGGGTILQIAIEEMGHMASVWNITAALGGALAHRALRTFRSIPVTCRPAWR